MTALIFDDIVAVSVAKLQTLLDGRGESYTDGAEVSNRVIAGMPRMVTLEFAGGPGDLNTLDTTYLAANVYSPDEGDAIDLARMVRALITGRGSGTLCDGNPITYTALNVGPTPIENGTDQHQFRMLFQVQHRGVNL